MLLFPFSQPQVNSSQPKNAQKLKQVSVFMQQIVMDSAIAT